MSQVYPSFFARFYDVIYHKHRDGVDNKFFIDRIVETSGKVLEVGVGTGRLFTEALSKNADVYGIDISQPMLDVLKAKINPTQYFRISNQNIIDFKFGFKFDLIIAPFRVMMHLLSKNDQLAALNNVYAHLNPGGRFIFDTFVPNMNQLIKGFDSFVDFEGEYDAGKWVKRYVSTEPDLINQIINVTFRMEWDEEDRVRTEQWQTPLRFFFRYELEHLIERSDFKFYRIYGDYSGNSLAPDSKEFLVECIKKNT